MILHPMIRSKMSMNNNSISTSEVLKLGFSKTLLTKYVQSGVLIRVSQGLYALPESVIDDMYVLSKRSSRLIYSHESALYLHGLSDRTPHRHQVTIPTNTSLSKTAMERCDVFYIQGNLHSLGIMNCLTSFGNIVSCYNAERTICDLLRSRSRCDEQTVLDALKAYVRWPNRNLPRLSEYSSVFKVRHAMQTYLEVLL